MTVEEVITDSTTRPHISRCLLVVQALTPYKLMKVFVGNMLAFRKLFEGKRFAIRLYKYIIPDVRPLFFWGSPSAIARGVVSIGVDSIQRVTMRPTAHIYQKLREVINPTGVHSDSAAAVDWKLFIVRIVATALCVTPSLIFYALCVANSLSVFNASLPKELRPEAPTATTNASIKSITMNNLRSPTLAAAKPTSMVAIIWGATNHGKSAVLSSGSINQFHGVSL